MRRYVKTLATTLQRLPGMHQIPVWLFRLIAYTVVWFVIVIPMMLVAGLLHRAGAPGSIFLVYFAVICTTGGYAASLVWLITKIIQNIGVHKLLNTCTFLSRIFFYCMGIASVTSLLYYFIRDGISTLLMSTMGVIVVITMEMQIRKGYLEP